MQVKIFIAIIVKRNERSVKLIAKKNIHARNKAMKQTNTASTEARQRNRETQVLL